MSNYSLTCSVIALLLLKNKSVVPELIGNTKYVCTYVCLCDWNCGRFRSYMTLTSSGSRLCGQSTDQYYTFRVNGLTTGGLGSCLMHRMK